MQRYTFYFNLATESREKWKKEEKVAEKFG